MIWKTLEGFCPVSLGLFPIVQPRGVHPKDVVHLGISGDRGIGFVLAHPRPQVNGHRDIARAICVNFLDRTLKSWSDHLDFVSHRRYFIPSQVAPGCGSLSVELSRHSEQRQRCCFFHTRVSWSLDVNVETDRGTDLARPG